MWGVFEKIGYLILLAVAAPFFLFLLLAFGGGSAIAAILNGILFILRNLPSVLIVGGVVWGLVLLQRYQRDKESLEAFKDCVDSIAMEKDRIKARRIALFAVVLCPVVFVVVLMMGAGFWAALISAGFCVFGGGAWAASIRSGFNVNFKDNLVKARLSKDFDNVTYEPKGRFGESSLKTLDFFRSFDRIDGGDLIDATYKGLHFTQCDLRVNSFTGEDGKGGIHFKGLAKRFDFADKFRGRVQVVAKNFKGAKVKEKSSRGAWQPVYTELAEFSRHFDVFALDPIDAMAVLTPQMIEGIFYLQRAVSYPTAFYFIENTMLTFITTGRDAFDASGKRTLLEERELLDRDIALTTGFMEVMYFKRQAPMLSLEPEADISLVAQSAEERTSTADVSLTTRSAEERIAAAGHLAGSIGPSEAEQLKHGAGFIVDIIPLAIIAVYLISAVYGIIQLPDGIALSASRSGGVWMVPPGSTRMSTILYMIMMGFFIILPAWKVYRFAPRNISSAGIGAVISTLAIFIIPMIPMMIHLMFMAANLR